LIIIGPGCAHFCRAAPAAAIELLMIYIAAVVPGQVVIAIAVAFINQAWIAAGG